MIIPAAATPASDEALPSRRAARAAPTPRRRSSRASADRGASAAAAPPRPMPRAAASRGPTDDPARASGSSPASRSWRWRSSSAGVAGYVFLPTATRRRSRRASTPSARSSFDDRAPTPTATEIDARRGCHPRRSASTSRSRRTGRLPGDRQARRRPPRRRGTVRFDSINTVGPVAIPAGTRDLHAGRDRVRDRPRRDRARAPRSTAPPSSTASCDVNVRAVKEGPDGNVEAGEITQVPASLSTLQVSRAQPRRRPRAASSRSSRGSQQEDVDAALAQLADGPPARSFEAALESPPGLPEGATLFTADGGARRAGARPSTRRRSSGQELEAFTLEATADGLRCWPSTRRPLEALVRERLTGMVTAGRELVDGLDRRPHRRRDRRGPGRPLPGQRCRPADLHRRCRRARGGDPGQAARRGARRSSRRSGRRR